MVDWPLESTSNPISPEHPVQSRTAMAKRRMYPF
jgi:hypothetical protein